MSKMVASELLEPDKSQAALLRGPLDERRLVVAGPGAGKTTVSVLLISEICRDSTYSGRTVLYISFSRAAMRAAFGAFGGADEDGWNGAFDVLPMTMDSFAWQITEQDHRGSSEWPDFDEVVRLAICSLTENYSGELDDVAHLIVDEAQDLSPVRQDLLFAIIERLPSDAGVTIFGDPMQSIYGFLNQDAGNVAQSWRRLLNGLSARSVTRMYRLDGAHRAHRAGPRKVASALLHRDLSDRAGAVESLDDLMTEFSIWDVPRFVKSAQEWTGSTAVLARTNAEVIGIFQILASLGLRCAWNSPRQVQPRVSSVIAELWSRSRGRALTFEQFREVEAVEPGLSSEWFSLMLSEVGSGQTVDWSAFARTLDRSVDPSLPWLVGLPDGVAVSTIHRSKGLEWDNVAVVEGADLLSEFGGRQPEPELAYVALSRARKRIVFLECRQPLVVRDKASRLYYQPHPKWRRPISIGITPSCLAPKQVGGESGQRVLAVCDRHAMMEFELLASGRAEWPVYRCRIDGLAVGVTSDDFGRGLAKLLGSPRGDWPLLGSVPIDGVETAWSTVDGARFWLKPRPLGMSAVEYKKES
ncbi:AAA family ATPase [Dietzia maris]|uniref:AAA family ATPase n=1 Tax=Dietzia maris TaxID=37915 RepID=A0AAE4R0T1_9ACTN|nr:UvrD-helicase domain-containing protein [Dietzia maris]MDV6299482.1 AAA family ATPase [Dietzia maris]